MGSMRWMIIWDWLKYENIFNVKPGFCGTPMRAKKCATVAALEMRPKIAAVYASTSSKACCWCWYCCCCCCFDASVAGLAEFRIENLLCSDHSLADFASELTDLGGGTTDQFVWPQMKRPKCCTTFQLLRFTSMLDCDLNSQWINYWICSIEFHSVDCFSISCNIWKPEKEKIRIALARRRVQWNCDEEEEREMRKLTRVDTIREDPRLESCSEISLLVCELQQLDSSD